MNKIVLIFIFGLLTKSAIGWQDPVSCPKSIEPCSKYDPNFSTCLTENLQRTMNEMRQESLKSGNKSLGPYFIGDLALQQNDSSADVDFQLSNVKVEGLSTVRVEQNSFDDLDLNWRTVFGMPLLQISGNYIVKGRILRSNNLDTQGYFSVTLRNPEIEVITHTKLYEKAREVFCDIIQCDVEFILDHVDFKVDKICNDPLLETMAQVNLQTDPKKYFNALGPTFRKAASSFVTNYFRKMGNVYPLRCFIRELPSGRPFNG